MRVSVSPFDVFDRITYLLSIFIPFMQRNRKYEMCISEEEIQEYAEFIDIKSKFELKPVECSICSLNYREHILEKAGDHYLTKIFIKRGVPITIDDPDSDSYAEIGPASMNFINYFRFEDFYKNKSLDSMFEELHDMIKTNHYAIRTHRLLNLYVFSRIDLILASGDYSFREFSIRFPAIAHDDACESSR